MTAISVFTIPRSGQPAARFRGRLVARVSNDSSQARWLERSVYLLESGRMAVHKLGGSRKPGEECRSHVELCESIEQVAAYLRGDKLAAKMMHALGVDYVEDIE